MSSIWRRLSGKPCSHEQSLIVTSVGVRRIVCEQCGHISFAMEPRTQRAPEDIEKTKMAKAAGF
ncbi:MAG TPA: hypothetical protein VEB69_09345 [Acidimicrobiia bacterium]|nr:hypothetical protein [Acidimicrobiia bacterium]